MGDIVIKWYKCVCLLAVIIIIVSCSLITPMTTSSTSIKELSFAKTTTELLTEYYTDKTATDHAVSFVLGKDCKMTRAAKREKICEDIKPKIYEDKNKNKISMVGLNSEPTIVPIIEQKHSTKQISMLTNAKKVEGIKKNNIEVLKNHGSEVLAHNVLNNRNFYKSNSDQIILANNLSSIHTPLEKNFNKMKEFNNKNKNTEVLGYLKSSAAKPVTKNINKMKEFNNKNKNTEVLGYLKKRI